MKIGKVVSIIRGENLVGTSMIRVYVRFGDRLKEFQSEGEYSWIKPGIEIGIKYSDGIFGFIFRDFEFIKIYQGVIK
jgi:hypothetical protein